MRTMHLKLLHFSTPETQMSCAYVPILSLTCSFISDILLLTFFKLFLWCRIYFFKNKPCNIYLEMKLRWDIMEVIVKQIKTCYISVTDKKKRVIRKMLCTNIQNVPVNNMSRGASGPRWADQVRSNDFFLSVPLWPWLG